MSYYINRQSEELRRLADRNECLELENRCLELENRCLELENRSLVMREEMAYKAAKKYQAERDAAHKRLYVAYLIIVAFVALTVGWILR